MAGDIDFAHVFATATASADTMVPIAIAKTGDMNFGIVTRSNVNGWANYFIRKRRYE